MTSHLSLPAFQLEEDLAALVDAMRADTAAGPIELARRGVDVVLRFTDKSHYERPLHIWIEVNGLANALFEARRDCMPLANLASAIVEPLPSLYGRGKDEGARMRADLRSRTLEWLDGLSARSARIDVQRSAYQTATARAIDGHFVYLSDDPAPYVIGGVEKFVPPNYEFPSGDLRRVPLESFDGILTGDSQGPVSVDVVRSVIASLRFATTLL
jgi:hypothetical protein